MWHSSKNLLPHSPCSTCAKPSRNNLLSTTTTSFSILKAFVQELPTRLSRQIQTSSKMSFLYRTKPALRTLSLPTSRLFTSTALQKKSATETVKETARSVDRAVSDAAVSGIEKGRKISLYQPLFRLRLLFTTLLYF